MQLDIWHIAGEGFHFGRHGLGQEESGEHVPSDSLFAALVARLAEWDRAAVSPFVAAFRGETPPFALTSAFPRAGDVRLFPTPLRPPPAETRADGPRPKDLKKVKFVSEEAFRKLLKGSALAEVRGDGKTTLHNKSVALTPDEHERLPPDVRKDGKIYGGERRPRVTVGRAAQNSQLYFTGRTAFHKNCGLWFGVQWLAPTDELRQRLAQLLADLGNAGLGGERSTGFGQCRITQAGTVELPDPTELWVSLSRYLPRADEVGALSAPGAAYSIESVGGWVTSPVSVSERRRAVRLLAEGATLGKVSRTAPGDVVDIQPSYNGNKPLGHEVWRNGRAVAVGLSQ